jgi:SAM-dependent methyltransferase
MNISFPESTLKYCELQCNSVYFDYSTCPEVTLIQDYLANIVPPKYCLDIGSGIGRVSVYLNNFFAWPKTKYWLLDGDSGDQQIAGMNYEPKRAFYNSRKATHEFCTANGLTNFEFINMDEFEPIPTDRFDLCYSCKAIGFHWPLKDYLAILGYAAKAGAHLFFELRSKDKDHYKEEKRWERACRFTDVQLKCIESDPRYTLIDTRSNREIFIAIVKKNAK